jgi:membrane fusion protein (multidrug efflux system)
LSNNFSRTLRALRADGLTGWAVRAFLAALLLSVWAWWFFLGGITLWAVSESARAEIRDQVSPIESPVDGQVVAVHFTRGQEVSKGDLLVELEALQQEGQREALGLELESMRARRDDLTDRIGAARQALNLWLNASQATVAEKEARLDEARSAADLAASEEARTRELFNQNLVSQGELDRAVAEREQKQAQAESAAAAAAGADSERAVERARRTAEIDEMQGDLDALLPSIRAEESKLATLEEEVGQRKIRAPATGRLARVADIRPGSRVEAGEELARVLPSGRIGAVAWYQPAEAVGRVRRGQHARMRLDAFPSTQFGTIPATVVVVDSEDTDGRIQVDLDFDSEPTNLELEHGMPGRVEVEVERISPASLLMRAVGKMLDQPAPDRSASQPDTGSPD